MSLASADTELLSSFVAGHDLYKMGDFKGAIRLYDDLAKSVSTLFFQKIKNKKVKSN
jgi:hypothetical protein